jgi:phosphate transport system protein
MFMAARFEQELHALRLKLRVMAGHALTAGRRAMQAFDERDDSQARQVQIDDSILDRFEIEVDDLAVLLLSGAPLAYDLRLITVIMKISHDLERIGDEATTISRRAIELNQEPKLKDYLDLPRMSDLGLQMLQDAIDAFLNRNPAKARAIIPRDKEVDALNKQLHRELAAFMIEKPSNITRCLNLMVISKSLERIADHATNIAEEVVFLHEGQDIRHQGQSSPV